MTATEVLRLQLDERGVDHEDYEGTVVRTTSWMANDGQSVTFMERLDNGKTMFVFDTSAFTPEEAVAATLGAGTCRLKRAQWDDGTCTWGCICTACDAHLEHETGIGYNYCPHCGAKVVDA